MSLSRKVTSFNIGTGTGTVLVPHGLGEAPKVIILQWGGNPSTVDSATGGTIRRGVGWAIGSGAGQMYAWGATEENGGAAGTGNFCKKIAVNDGCVVTVTTAGALDGKADVQSWDATNVTFEVLDQFAADIRITMLALGGSDIANVAVGDFTSPAANGTVDYTSLGFDPLGGGRSLLLMASHSDTVAFGTANPCSQLAVGAAVSAAKQGVVYSGGFDLLSPTTVYRKYARSDEMICATVPTSPNSIEWRSVFDAWVTGGFRLNHTETSAVRAHRAGYLVINGPRFAVETGLTSVTLGADVTHSGVGFQPLAGLVWSICGPESTAGSTGTDGDLSLGAWDDTGNQAAHGVAAHYGDTTSACARGWQEGDAYANLTASGGLQGRMAVVSQGADGCTYDMSAGDNAANRFFSVLIADAPGTAQVTRGGLWVATGVKDTAGAFGATTGTLAESRLQARLALVLRPISPLPPNNSPVLAALTSQIVQAGSALSVFASATDADTEDILVYSLSAGLTAVPAGMSINSSTGEITWLTADADIGIWDVTVGVTDGTDTDSAPFTVSVVAPPDASGLEEVVTRASVDLESIQALVTKLRDAEQTNASVYAEIYSLVEEISVSLEFMQEVLANL